MDYLKKFIAKVEAEDDSYERAYTIATKGADFLASLREDVDVAECYVSDAFWPLPTYDELLLSI